MRCCFVFRELSVGILELSDAPPTLEFRDPTSIMPRTRVMERLTSVADPVNGIVLYEEVAR